MKKILSVKEMTCGHCVKRVKRVIEKTEGTSDVSVSLKKSEASFSYDPEWADVATITQAITDLGYPATEK
jgi:copper ion binding protein